MEIASNPTTLVSTKAPKHNLKMLLFFMQLQLSRISVGKRYRLIRNDAIEHA